MLILNPQETRAALPMPELIQAMKEAYAALTLGKAQVPLRSRLEIPPHEGTTLLMPAYVQTETEEALAVKIVSLFPGNPARGLAFIQAAVLALEPDTGRPLALMDGAVLTARRTGAASGAATDLLARPDSRVAAIFGAGTQARTQLEAVCTVRPIEEAWIYDPDTARLETYLNEMQPQVSARLRAAQSPRQAVAEADIICTATTATAPVFEDAALKPGVHINGVGSYTPQMVELPPETLRRAAVFVDSREAVLAEAGEIIAALREEMLSPEGLTELGAVAAGQAPGRRDEAQITVFKSVGVAVQDALATQVALKHAQSFHPQAKRQ